MQKSFPVKAGQEWKENPERTAPGDRKPLFTGYTGKEGIFFAGSRVERLPARVTFRELPRAPFPVRG